MSGVVSEKKIVIQSGASNLKAADLFETGIFNNAAPSYNADVSGRPWHGIQNVYDLFTTKKM